MAEINSVGWHTYHHDVHNRIGRGHVQHLGPDFRGAGPPYPALFGAVVVEGLDQGALTLHDTPSVCSDTHFENKVHPAVPAVINGRAERGTCSVIVGRRRNEEYEVLPQFKLVKNIDTIIY